MIRFLDILCHKVVNLLVLSITILCILLPVSIASGRDPGTSQNPTNISKPQVISFVLDGVELTLSTPFLPGHKIILPEPGDPVQVANIVQREPLFRSLTVTAIPFGTKPGAEVFPTAEAGMTDAYLTALRTHRRFQGGEPEAGPVATLFGQEVTGIASTVYLDIDVFDPKPVRIVEWIVEAGDRFWLLRISQEIQERETLSNGQAPQPTMAKLAGITLFARNLDVPSSSLANQHPAIPPVAATATDTILPFPSWWDGDCDLYTYLDGTAGLWSSYPLGGAYRGVKACGPRPWADGAPDVFTLFFPGSWGVLEWECVELSMRFLYLAYGIAPYQANGNQVVNNYSGAELIKINNGTPGIAPQPGDVISSGPETTYGHTVVVTASNVNLSGDGTLTILEQNSSPTGTRTLAVTDWQVQSFYPVIGWLHDPNPGTVLYFPLLYK